MFCSMCMLELAEVGHLSQSSLVLVDNKNLAALAEESMT